MTSDDDNDFTKTPVSISEHRARTQDKAKLWTPRDALINTLRRIDSGELNAVNLVMMIETDTSYHTVIATPDEDKTIALYYRGLHGGPRP